jgi:carbamate kinase
MSKTVILEELPPEARRVIEEMASAEEPVIISRGGKPLVGIIAYDSLADRTTEWTPEEEAAVRAAVAQGEADYAAGRHLTLDEFKARYAAKLREGGE